jgi:membrane protein
MSLRENQIQNLKEKIIQLVEKEKTSTGIKKFYYQSLRWLVMLYAEFIKDDVKVRAESLAFLMIFSLLPLIAGCFFIFTIFTQFGLVQEAIGGFVGSFLETFPVEHRELILEYTVKFKDAYLASIAGKSGTLGIFSLLILIWVGLQAFNNMDRTLNFIWSSDQVRPFLEKFRNFIVVAVAAPLVLTASLSVPLILRKIPATRLVLETVPLINTLLNSLIPLTLIFGTFTLLYKFVPVRKVIWKAALIGGAFSGVLLQLTNYGMQYYIKFGTNSAYGKAAILPLLGFWIFIVWIVIILGAEVSYLVQNEKYVIASHRSSPTLSEAEGLFLCLLTFQEVFESGAKPVDFESLFNKTGLSLRSLKKIIAFLESHNLIVEVAAHENTYVPRYSLAKEIKEETLAHFLEKFINENQTFKMESSHPLGQKFQQSLQLWTHSFANTKIKDFAAKKTV